MYDTQPAPRSASAQVVAHVKEAIRSGRLSPGQRLLESELTSRLGMSRGPVREALAQLQVEGFIDVEPHRGARVHQMSRDAFRRARTRICHRTTPRLLCGHAYCINRTSPIDETLKAAKTVQLDFFAGMWEKPL